MAASLLGVVYDEAAREPKRLVNPDEDWQLLLHIGPGEGMLVFPKPFPGPIKTLNVVARFIDLAREHLQR